MSKLHPFAFIRVVLNQVIRAGAHSHKYPVVCVVMAQWERDLHARISQAIKVARGKRSAQWLADRTVELGYPVTRAQIANYESGRKMTLDIAELIALASALNTSPVALVYPGPYDEEVELFPGESWSQFTAAQWFSAIPSEPYEEMSQWRSETRDLNLWRRLDALESSRASILILTGDAEADEQSRALFYKQMAMYDSEIRELKQQIHLTEVERGWGLDESEKDA